MSHMSGVRPHRVGLVLEVEVDPVAHGFNLSFGDAREVAVAAINAVVGLHVRCPVAESGEDES